MSFRLDRFLTLCIFRPLSRLSRSKGLHIPILMYHSISDVPESGHPYYWTNTSPARFAEHMKYLYDNKYNVISLSEATNLLSSGNSINSMNSIGPAALRPKYAVLTFDDGFADFCINAFPLLSKYRFNATVFLPTGFIGRERTSFQEKGCMTWDEIRQLTKAGVSFGSHTVSHPQLKKLSEKEIEYEIKLSKEKIEDETGTTVYSFSYPFAFPQEDRNFVIKYKKELIEQGYHIAVTTTIGRAAVDDDLLILKRLPVNNCDDRRFFHSKLEGAYDWLYKPQHFYKIINRILQGYA